MAAVSVLAWLSVDYFGYELLTEIAILAILAMSLDLLVGFAGMVSLGHAAFYGIGAYAIAAFTTMLGWPAAASMAIAVLASGAAAMLVGAIAVRLGGIFFIMVTLAIGEAVHAYLFKVRAFGGDDGLAGIPQLDLSGLGVDLADPRAFAALALIAAAVVYVILELVVRSPFGRLLLAIHQNERRARALGCRVERVKLGAFTLAGALAGLAGALTAQHTGFISPELLVWTISGEALIVVIVGGMGSLVGAAAGAAVIVLAKHWISDWTDYWMLCMGGAFIAVVVLAPNGIYALLGAVQRRLPRAAR
ncbi:MAG: branched-chain amino acid ABC transporter permease [Alphaproteobacteria bacterium]|nr:branched-chain amino acid ABC transporter permease [Alphaproteobacteria bacterium]